jgi:hypothetical protein
MADFDSRLPVRGLATDLTTEVANAAGTTINPVEEFPQASVTPGQSGPLDQGATTTSPPTYTTGTTNPLSLDTAGNLRVIGTTGSTTVVTGNVTVVQPIGTNLHTVVDNFPADTDAYAQGSTTVGQLGNVPLGAVTTTAPTYITATSNPLSLTTGGALRVSLVESNPQSELINYNTVSSVAPSATSTHTFTPGGPVFLDAFNFAASGQMKVEIQIAGVTQFVYFTSKSELSYELELVNPISTSAVVTLIRTNTDKQAMDVYSSVQFHL